MKKNFLLYEMSLLMTIMSFIFAGCDESSLEIPYIEIAPVAKFERDATETYFTYNSDKKINEYNIYINKAFSNKVSVNRYASNIYCVANDVSYEIKLCNTRGGTRAELVIASTLDGARLYSIEYWYDDDGRIKKAALDGVDVKRIYNHYEYESDRVIIDDAGTQYILQLSSEENLGNVCNVLDFANAPITSAYIINPDLYFLNIYGILVNKLPSGQVVTRCNDGKNLSRVGKYYYEY